MSNGKCTDETAVVARSRVSMPERELSEFCRANDVAYLGVFGSVARGDDTDASDIDLLVRFAHPKSLLEIVRIERELSERLGRKVDLLTERAISPHLRDRILSSVKQLYEAA